jgi:Leucine-rich repeat (LRR) protein
MYKLDLARDEWECHQRVAATNSSAHKIERLVDVFEQTSFFFSLSLLVLRVLSNRVECLGSHIGMLQNLTVLDIGKNRLTKIDVNALSPLSGLKELLLQWNQLTECPVVLGCTSLRKLQLSINRISVLHESSLVALTQLEELDISHNRLTSLPNLPLPSVVVLNCVGNDLRSFPAEIQNLRGLTELNAQMNLVEELPPELGSLDKLRKLKLKKNLIREFPREIGNLASLEELLIGDNQFTNLPRTIGQLKKLSVRGTKILVSICFFFLTLFFSCEDSSGF